MSAETPAAAVKLGRYVLERRIASGGMADVYLARQVGAFGFAKNVAVKVLRSDVSGDADHVRMFLREAMVAAEFKHPNLVQVYEVGEEGGKLYLAMELVRGISLATIMQLLAAKKRSVPVPLAARIARDALEGLAQAHEATGADGHPLRVVHRDVTPQNILVDVAGTVKVVDFGIARAETRAGRTQGAQIKGKFGYMAPEQWATNTEIDARADLFSLGVVLYEMSTGSRRLFRGTTAPELYRAIMKDTVPPPTLRVADYPEDLSRVVMRALERDVSHRWASAHAMRDALDEAARAHRWNVTSEDLARLVAMALDGRSIEERWELIAAGQIENVATDVDDVAVAAVAAMEASRTPSLRPLSGPFKAAAAPAPSEPPPASASSATVSARPAALGLPPSLPPPPALPSFPAPTALLPPPAPPIPAPPIPPTDPPPQEPVGPVAPHRNPAVWMGAAVAGWLVALALGVTWWRARARVTVIEGNAPVAVAPPPPAPREVPAPAVLLADPTLADGVAAPWASLLEGSGRGARARVDAGGALERLLLGEGDAALRAGEGSARQAAEARALGFDLRSPASAHVVGYDHAVVVVHPSNPLPSLTGAQLVALFAGRLGSFRALHGSRAAPRLVVCGAGAPTRAFLDDFVMPAADARHPAALAPGAEVVVDEAAAVARVASDPAAVALVRLAWLRPGVRAVPVAAPGGGPVAATRESIRAGHYPLVRPVVLYTRAAPVGPAQALLGVALSPAGQTHLERAGYVSR